LLRPRELPFKLTFVGGMPRSGTTFLQIVLESHAGIATARETHLADFYLGRCLKNLETEERLTRSLDGIRHYVGMDQMADLFRTLGIGIFEKFLAGKSGAQVVLEKTPANIEYIRYLNMCFPEAIFLHIIRDPRAVVASMKAAAAQEWGSWAKQDVGQIARRWLQIVERAELDSAPLEDRYLQIQYEDLLVRGNAVINDVFRRIGISPIEGLPADLRTRFPLNSMKDLGFAADHPRHETRPDFFRLGEADSWRKELTQVEIASIEAICGRKMKTLGYDGVAVA
jgi:hypothetical protein